MDGVLNDESFLIPSLVHAATADQVEVLPQVKVLQHPLCQLVRFGGRHRQGLPRRLQVMEQLWDAIVRAVVVDALVVVILPKIGDGLLTLLRGIAVQAVERDGQGRADEGTAHLFHVRLRPSHPLQGVENGMDDTGAGIREGAV